MQTYRSPSQHYAFKQPLTEAEWVTIQVGILRKDNRRPNDTLSIPQHPRTSVDNDASGTNTSTA